MHQKILYLPIEIKARELLGKLLLAAKAVERGWIVVMGAKKEINQQIESLPPGVFVEISIPDHKQHKLSNLKKQGFLLTNLCEESIVYHDPYDYVSRKIGDKSLAVTDWLFTPGSLNENDLLIHSPETKGKAFVCGNPRFDTLLQKFRVVYEAEAGLLRKKFGKFLLVNTNFGGTSNPFKRGQDVTEKFIKSGYITDTSLIETRRRFTDYKIEQMTKLQLEIEKIVDAGIFDRVVIRPHPTENQEVWREWIPNNKVEVWYEGSANTWMLAAHSVLHTGCTTGIEGLLLDIPIFSFCTEPESEFLNIADDISMQVNSAKELLSYIEQLDIEYKTSFERLFATKRQLIKPYIQNISGLYSSDLIMDKLDSVTPAFSSGANRLDLVKRFQPKKNHWKYQFRSVLERLSRKKIKTKKVNQKFPSIAASDIRIPLALWSQNKTLKKLPAYSRIGEKTWILY